MSSLLGTGEDGNLLETVVDSAVHVSDGHPQGPRQNSPGQPAQTVGFVNKSCNRIEEYHLI